MVFITAGLGGGTGSGGAPVIAEIAKDLGALTIGVVTKPFAFEGNRASSSPRRQPKQLKAKVDTLITIPNDRLRDVVAKNTSILDAFRVVDDVLRQGVQGISDIITVPGLINLDFADVKAIMHDAGSALMGIGRASGENRAVEAARQAIASPLLEVNITGAQGILFNISGSSNLTLYEVTEAAEEIRAAADPEANIIFGASFDERLGEDVVITVIATGFDGTRRREAVRRETAERPYEVSRIGPSGARFPRRAGAAAQRGGRRDAPGGAAVHGPGRARLGPRGADRGGDRAGRERAPDVRRGRPGDPELPSSHEVAPPVPDPSGVPAAEGPPDPAAVARFVAARTRVLGAVADACARSGRDPAGVMLVAVSKTVDAGNLRAAVAAGLTTPRREPCPGS